MGKVNTQRGQEAHRLSSCIHSLFMEKRKTKLLYVCVCVCARAGGGVIIEQRNIRERWITIKKIIQMLKLLKD